MNAKNVKTLNLRRIMDMIPHRYPFLLIDRIVECVAGESAVGIKNVTINEPHFQGHFPGFPIMPGVLIVEAMAQTAAAVVVEGLGRKAEGKIVYFMTIDGARFRKPVSPGDTLHIHVQKIHARARVWKFKGVAKVDGVVCAEAAFSAMISGDSPAS